MANVAGRRTFGTHQNLKEEIENLKLEADQAERAGDFGKVAELRYGRIKETEAALEKAKVQLVEMQANSKMIKEEVDAEEIADVVSKWTGIPVSIGVAKTKTLSKVANHLAKKEKIGTKSFILKPKMSWVILSVPPKYKEVIVTINRILTSTHKSNHFLFT